MDDPAWPVLLQHDSIRKELGVVCRLLCCSKVLHAAVSKYSAGQLTICIGQHPCGPAADLQAEGKQYEHLATWISANGRLLHTLDISEGALKYSSDFPAETLLASALAATADSATKGTSRCSSNSGGRQGGSSSIAAGGGMNVVAQAALDIKAAVQEAEESVVPVPVVAGTTNPANSVAAAPPPPSPKTGPRENANAEAAAAAQPAAHVDQQQLALHTFRAANITSPALLQHLPGRLRSLSITLPRSCTAEQAQQIASSLSRLTGLTQLCINISNKQALVTATLTSFRQLQVLDLHQITSLAALQHLPQQLKQLHFTGGPGCTRRVMQLQHLTALTALDCSSTGKCGSVGIPVLAGDALPAGLVLLQAGVRHLGPVLALRHLQKLKISVAKPAIASQLDRLTALQALTGLHLETSQMAAACTALLQLPIQHLKVSGDLPIVAVKHLKVSGDLPIVAVKHLKVSGDLPIVAVKHLKVSGDLPIVAVRQLRRLHGLTSLVLVCCRLQCHYQHLSKSLQQLTGLQQLLVQTKCRPALLDSAGLSLQFVAALPQLQSCKVRFTPLDAATITTLQAATGLTCLGIDHCCMAQDWAVAPVVQKLTSLQHLSLAPRIDRQNVTSVVLPAIAQLTHLTYLNLNGTAVKLSCVLCLTALHQLKELRLVVSQGRPSRTAAAVNMAVVMQLTSLSHLTSLWLSARAFRATEFPGSSEKFKSMLCKSLQYCDVTMHGVAM